MIRIGKHCTIDPLSWVDSTEKKFLERFKGKLSPDDLKKKFAEVKAYKVTAVKASKE